MAAQIFGTPKAVNTVERSVTPFEEIARDIGLSETLGACEQRRRGELYLCGLAETESSYSSYRAWEGV